MVQRRLPQSNGGARATSEVSESAFTFLTRGCAAESPARSAGAVADQRGDKTITIWRFSIRGICSTLEVGSISVRIRSKTRAPIS